jgi:uncharacterized protein YukE
MGINYWGAINCGRNISVAGERIGSAASKMSFLGEFVPSSYEGEDASLYLNAEQQLQREIKSISNELINVGNRIISSANSIRREEEEEARKQIEAALNSLKETVSKELW